MPCYDPTPEDDRREAARELDKRTDMLCRVMTLIEKAEPGTRIPQDIVSWWVMHKEFDERRRVQEQRDAAKRKIRDAAIATLTPKQRKDLGI